MSFLRVNDLLFVCIVQNHDADSPLYDADSPLYIIRKYVFIGNN